MWLLPDGRTEMGLACYTGIIVDGRKAGVDDHAT